MKTWKIWKYGYRSFWTHFNRVASDTRQTLSIIAHTKVDGGDYPTKIAFLGWGSLIWDLRDLQITGSWETDGPLLPVEFARVSQDGRLTLVLYPDVSDVPVLWARAAHKDLQQAIDNLRRREGTSTNSIGFLSIPDNRSRYDVIPDILPRIRCWAKEKGLDAVVWTALPSNFQAKTKMEFNEDNVVKYLRSLKGDALHDAETYVRKAPEQIETKIRNRIRQEFGWENAPFWTTSRTPSGHL